MREYKHIQHFLEAGPLSSSIKDREIPAPTQGVYWNEEDWQRLLQERLQSRLGRTGYQAQSLATHTQTGPGRRFAASASGVWGLWVFLSPVGSMGNAHRPGFLIRASVAQATGACPGLDCVVGFELSLGRNSRLAGCKKRLDGSGWWMPAA